MSDENTSYVGNKAETGVNTVAVATSQNELKHTMPDSPSSDGVSIDDQSDEESASSGDEVDDMTAESDLKPYIFSSDGARRSFVVQQITRANSSHRPSFTFLGYAVEYMDGRGSQTERGNSAGNMSSREHRTGSQTARGGQSQRSRIVVIATGLSLNITYEPPSPKFHQQCPGSSSYRLKLFQATEFLYSVRGLPQQVKVHQNAYIVRWGPLELQYNSKQQLDMFTTAVKHVELQFAPCGQHTARQTAAAMRPKPTPTPLAPLSTNVEPPLLQRSSFGSPLPEPIADESLSTVSDAAVIGESRDATDHAATESANIDTSKEDSPPQSHSFLNSNWVWLGLGMAAVAVVAYSVLKTDAPTAQASKSVRVREYKLHVVE